MKFKKTCILLIIISLFLLVSIGSVCAEDMAADADIQSTDDESVDILADESGDPGGDEIQEKINTTVTTDKEEYKFSENDDKNISVSVKDNESNEMNINENELTVFEGNKALNFTYNNSKIALTDHFNVGAYNITINYLGNLTYNNSSKIILLKIFGEKSLKLDDTVVINGSAIEIPVQVFDGVDYINVAREDFGSLTLTYTNSTGNRTSEIIYDFTVQDGKIKFDFTELNKLIAATITVNYINGTDINGTTSIKHATRVNADDDRIHETQNYNKTVSVSVLNNDQTLVITKNDLKVLEDGKEIAFDYNNSIINISSLKKGVHTLTIIYKGNETYYTSNKTITVKVWGNNTINPSGTANVDENNNVTITLNFGNGAELLDINKTNLTLVLMYGTVPKNYTIHEITDFTVDGQNITFKIDVEFNHAYVDIQYNDNGNVLTGTTTIKVPTNITANDFEAGASQVKNFTVNVTGINGAKVNVSASNIKVYNNGKEVKIAYNGNNSFTITDTLDFGIYNLTIKFIGDGAYAESTKNIILKLYGINATSSVNVNSTKKGEKDIKINIINGNETVDFTQNDLTITASTKNGNDTKAITISSWSLENGTIKFQLADADFTTAILTIKYNNTEFNVTLNRVYNVKITPVTTSVEYHNGKFTFKVTDIDNNNALLKGKSITISLTKDGSPIVFITKTASGSYSISTAKILTTDNNGIATLVNKDFYTAIITMENIYAPVGNYEISFSNSGVVKCSYKTNITITKATIKIVITPYKEYWGSSKKVKITATYAQSGEAVTGTILDIYMPKTTKKHYYVQTNSKGIAEIGASGLGSGDYEISVSNNDTTYFKKVSTKSTLKVLQKPVSVKVSVGNLYYNSGSTVTIKMTNKLTGKAAAGVYFLVQIDKGSKAYLIQTDKKGQFTFTYYFSVGKHSIAVATYDSKYVGNTVTKTFTVKKASATIKAPKVTDYYKGGKYFTIKLVNSKTKKPIYAGKLNVKIFINKNQYYKYDGKTGLNGQIRLLLDNLKPQKYKVEITGTDNKNFVAKKVTSKIVIKKAPTKLTPKKLKAKKGAKKYFKVKVTNKKTKKVIKGVKLKIKVYTGKKAKTFTAKSNSKGIAKILTKKLKVGKHKVVVTSDDKYCVAKKAKSKITIKK